MEEDFESKQPGEEKLSEVIHVSGMYKNWFIDYASYVILERAVPALEDGLKPVQRRILHALNEMDDGRFNKVANIIGQTMQYHPHGDASIGDAMVNLGQKDLLIETQGNWGDIRTGDSAAAPRYIEARLSKFAKDVAFNPQTTKWQASYDGRKKEPVNLPMKFPLLLAQGVEGIAVGLATKVLPHNFCELIEGSIQVLKGRKTDLMPDFPTGGQADFSNYNQGQKGGKVRVRARIEELDKKTLVIKDIPFGATTTGLIESIIKANDTGKIKIKKVIDNTARNVEIVIQLIPGTSPDITIDALYAFTDCEASISPNACVIFEDKPQFLSVNEILKHNTLETKDLLKSELEIRKGELLEKIFFSTLEKIFIREEMYIDFKEYSDKPTLFFYLGKRFHAFKKQFYREITDDDFEKLTQIPMIRITRFDSAKADEKMRELNEELTQVQHHLENLTDYAIDYFKKLLEKYGKGRERKTEIRAFDTITAAVVAAANQKLYINRAEGFVGYGMKKDEFVCDCSDIDDIIAFTSNGLCKVVKIADKIFVGKNIIWAGVFKKNDERMVYNLIYVDAKSGKSMVKRFQVLGITRDKDYDLTMGNKGSRAVYFSANPNGEAETVTVTLTPSSTARIKVFDFDFSQIAVKGRNSQGNTLTKYPVKKVVFKSSGVSTLGGVDIWYDDVVGRLNVDQRGKKLGNFQGEDSVLVIFNDGAYELTSFELTNRYIPEQIKIISKFNPESIISAIHYDGSQKAYYIKRFKIETSTIGKKFLFISESSGSKLMLVSLARQPQVEVNLDKGKGAKETIVYDLDVLIDVKGWKALGNKLTNHKVLKMKLLSDNVSEDEEVIPPVSATKVEATVKSRNLTASNKKDEEATESQFEVGDTVSFDLSSKKGDKPDQLGLF